MQILVAVLLGLIALLGTAPAGAQAFPTKTIHLVVPFPPGGGADAIARPLAPKLAKLLGQQVVIDNRPGANGNIGAGFVAKADPDGYTILIANSSLTISASLYSKLPFDPVNGFTPISLVAITPSVMVTHPSVPVKTAKELFALAKAQPGKLTYGSSGVGSTMHLGGELLQSMGNLKMLHVPYKGGGPAVTDLIGGQINLVFANPVALLSHINSGKVNALAITSRKRFAILPNVPTFIESGFPDLISYTFYGVLAPAGVPRDIVKRLNAAIVAAVAEDDLRKRLIALGYEVESNTPEEFEAFLKRDRAEWARLVKLSGASAN